LTINSLKTHLPPGEGGAVFGQLKGKRCLIDLAWPKQSNGGLTGKGFFKMLESSAAYHPCKSKVQI
jgi:hypothetical protein